MSDGVGPRAGTEVEHPHPSLSPGPLSHSARLLRGCFPPFHSGCPRHHRQVWGPRKRVLASGEGGGERTLTSPCWLPCSPGSWVWGDALGSSLHQPQPQARHRSQVHSLRGGARKPGQTLCIRGGVLSSERASLGQQTPDLNGGRTRPQPALPPQGPQTRRPPGTPSSQELFPPRSPRIFRGMCQSLPQKAFGPAGLAWE